MNPTLWTRIKTLSLAAGAAGTAAIVFGLLTDPQQFFQSYLYAWLFWFGVSFGSLGFLMLHHSVSSRWGIIVQRIFEAGAMNMILLVLMLFPILLGLDHLYEWAYPTTEELAANHHLAHRVHYLTPNWFMLRAAVFFAGWIIFAWLLRTWSPDQVDRKEQVTSLRMRRLAGPGMVFMFISGTLASVDWAMSLESDWFSTIYGVIFVIGGVLSAVSFASIVLIAHKDTEPIAKVISPKRVHDLGNFMLCFVLFWAYISFSQLLILWYGDLPEDARWLVRRMTTDWQWLGLAVCVLHFFLPFFILLNRGVKQDYNKLLKTACLVFVVRMIAEFWHIKPAFSPEHFSIHWMDIAALLGVGGWWITIFSWWLARRPTLPVRAENFQEVVHAH